MTPDTRYALEMKLQWIPFFYSRLSSRASASVQAGTSTNSDLNVSPASQTSERETTETSSASGDGSAAKEATLLRAKEAQPGLRRIRCRTMRQPTQVGFLKQRVRSGWSVSGRAPLLRGGANSRVEGVRMSEPKRPVPGEYWGCWNRPAVRIIGFDGLECVVRHKDGRLTTLATGNWQKTDGDWKHLPWCKSFDDVEPVAEVWPKYYVSRNMSGYFRRDSTTLHFWVGSDGVEVQQVADASILDCKTTFLELTESEALARLTPRCPDCGERAAAGHADVCQMAWVEITDPEHMYRDNVDQFACPPDVEWTWHTPKHVRTTLGEYRHTCSGGRARCRRKDLPPLPEPPVTRQQIRLWISHPTTSWPVLSSAEKPSSLHSELKYDVNGFYIEAQSSP